MERLEYMSQVRDSVTVRIRGSVWVGMRVRGRTQEFARVTQSGLGLYLRLAIVGGC